MGSNPTGAIGDVAQRQEQSLVRRKVRRFESGRPRSSRRSTSVSIRAEVADAGEADIGGVVVVV